MKFGILVFSWKYPCARYTHVSVKYLIFELKTTLNLTSKHFQKYLPRRKQLYFTVGKEAEKRIIGPIATPFRVCFREDLTFVCSPKHVSQSERWVHLSTVQFTRVFYTDKCHQWPKLSISLGQLLHFVFDRLFVFHWVSFSLVNLSN